MNQDVVQSSRSLSSRILRAGGIAVLAVLFFVGLTLVHLPLAHAATATPGQTTASCAVTYIQLHGNNPPTVTCVQKQAKGARPYIYVANCGGDPDFLMISNGSYWCFAGTGYISSGTVGVSGWYNVTYLTAFHCSWGWIRAYTSSGGSYPDWNDNGVYSGPTPPYNDVTQVDITAIDC
jgi:hypothetical protein